MGYTWARTVSGSLNIGKTRLRGTLVVAGRPRVGLFHTHRTRRCMMPRSIPQGQVAGRSLFVRSRRLARLSLASGLALGLVGWGGLAFGQQASDAADGGAKEVENS